VPDLEFWNGKKTDYAEGVETQSRGIDAERGWAWEVGCEINASFAQNFY